MTIDNNKTEMTAAEATVFTSDLVKQLQSRKVWCTVTNVNEPELRFIKIEASIKVK